LYEIKENLKNVGLIGNCYVHHILNWTTLRARVDYIYLSISFLILFSACMLRTMLGFYAHYIIASYHISAVYYVVRGKFSI